MQSDLASPSKHSQAKMILRQNILIALNPFTKIVVFVAGVDQDQAAQNMQFDLRSTLSAILKQDG